MNKICFVKYIWPALRRLYFRDEAGTKAKTKQIIISVKSGENVTVSQLRDLRGVIDRENAEIGVLISMAKPTRDMRKEATTALGMTKMGPRFRGDYTCDKKIEIATHSTSLRCAQGRLSSQ